MMNNIQFEEALKKLEESVGQLEAGDLPLDKALKVFEQGIKMSRICTKKLEEAEQKVELLLGVSGDGEAQTTLFDMHTIDE
jgi:exodeoxyribonuclease VII small subunit